MAFISTLAALAALSLGLQEKIALPDIAFQLEAMEMADQEVRIRLIEQSKAGRKLTLEDVHDQGRVDRENTRALKAIVGRYGWPTPKLVGKKGAHLAWLLVQHADLDSDFQERCLKLMEPLVKTGEVIRSDYAYLFDRVASAQGRPQRFGTQFQIKDGKAIMKPTENPRNLDARRKKMGMMPIAQYRKLLEEMYFGKK